MSTSGSEQLLTFLACNAFLLCLGAALGRTFPDAKSAALALAELTNSKVIPVKRKLKNAGAKKMQLA